MENLVAAAFGFKALKVAVREGQGSCYRRERESEGAPFFLATT
jgi:hypothetical protein